MGLNQQSTALDERHVSAAVCLQRQSESSVARREQICLMDLIWQQRQQGCNGKVTQVKDVEKKSKKWKKKFVHIANGSHVLLLFFIYSKFIIS